MQKTEQFEHVMDLVDVLRRRCPDVHQKLLRSGRTHEGVEYTDGKWWVVKGWCCPDYFHESTRVPLTEDNYTCFPQFLHKNIKRTVMDALYELRVEQIKDTLLAAALDEA